MQTRELVRKDGAFVAVLRPPRSGAICSRPHLDELSIGRGGAVLLCGTCMDARGLTDAELVEGAQRSTLAELAERTLAADQVLVF